MKRSILAVSFIIIALLPFIRLFLIQQQNGLTGFGESPSVTITGNAVIATSDQYMGFLLKKDALVNFFFEHYDEGFFKVGNENGLYSTMIALEAFDKIKYISQLSEVMLKQIQLATRTYYNSNKGFDWFSPSLSYSYYRIQQILGESLTSEETDEIVGIVMSFKVEGSGFSSKKSVNNSKSDVSETYYATKLLDEAGYDLTGVKYDIIEFLSEEKELDALEYSMIREIGEILGVKSSVPREVMLSCLVKQYLPLTDSPACSKLLRENNILVYFPSLLMIIIGYFLLVAR